MSHEREAWLSGTLEGVSPVLMPAAHALLQAARDIEQAAHGLGVMQVWMQPHGAPSAGFHLRHIAGSVNRLLTYARGEQLTDSQLAALAAENHANNVDDGASLAKLANTEINQAVAVIKVTDERTLFDNRSVGRDRLPTNIIGLLFHIAEHTQRHTGQLVTTAKIVRGMTS